MRLKTSSKSGGLLNGALHFSSDSCTARYTSNVLHKSSRSTYHVYRYSYSYLLSGLESLASVRMPYRNPYRVPIRRNNKKRRPQFIGKEWKVVSSACPKMAAMRPYIYVLVFTSICCCQTINKGYK